MTGSIPRLYAILDAALIPSREADVRRNWRKRASN